MIKFKTLKYKHQRQAQELNAKIKEGEATNDEINLFVIGMIEAWDFADAETGQPLPLDKTGLEEMSLDQFREMTRLFNEAMEVGTSAVPKVNGARSSSGSTESKAARKSPRRRPAG